MSDRKRQRTGSSTEPEEALADMNVADKVTLFLKEGLKHTYDRHELLAAFDCFRTCEEAFFTVRCGLSLKDSGFYPNSCLPESVDPASACRFCSSNPTHTNIQHLETVAQLLLAIVFGGTLEFHTDVENWSQANQLLCCIEFAIFSMEISRTFLEKMVLKLMSPRLKDSIEANPDVLIRIAKLTRNHDLTDWIMSLGADPMSKMSIQKLTEFSPEAAAIVRQEQEDFRQKARAVITNVLSKSSSDFCDRLGHYHFMAWCLPILSDPLSCHGIARLHQIRAGSLANTWSKALHEDVQDLETQNKEISEVFQRFYYEEIANEPVHITRFHYKDIKNTLEADFKKAREGIEELFDGDKLSICRLTCESLNSSIFGA